MTDQKNPQKPAAPRAKKSYRVLSNVLGEPEDGTATRLNPFKLFRKGSAIELSDKDAKALLASKAIEAIETVEPVKVAK